MSKKTVSVNDYKEIIETISKYVEAIRTGSIDVVADAFHKDSVTYGIVDGQLMGGSGNPTAEFIRINGKSPDITYHIDVLDMTPSTAVARLVTEKDAIGSDCSEYLTLIKINMDWIIISKVFLQFDK